jgi:hypothetical protein
MTTLSIESVGLCAHFSPPGEWAFDVALALARRRWAQLNVFHFLVDPFDPSDHCGAGLTGESRARLIVEREKELRFHYEDRLGDWIKIGFRLCEEKEWTELHRCLLSREFQVLVLPWPATGATFGGTPLLSFVNAFACPVILVGPGSPAEIHVNPPAAMIADQLGLAELHWSVVEVPVGAAADRAAEHTSRV